LETICRRLGHAGAQTTPRYAEQRDATADAEFRTRVLNDNLASDFARWYPDLAEEQTEPASLTLAT
jgi:hypothetical protein